MCLLLYWFTCTSLWRLSWSHTDIMLPGALENRAQFLQRVCFAINLMPFLSSHLSSSSTLCLLMALWLLEAISPGTGLENFLADNYLPFVPCSALWLAQSRHLKQAGSWGKTKETMECFSSLCGFLRAPTKKGQMQKTLPWPKYLLGRVKTVLVVSSCLVVISKWGHLWSFTLRIVSADCGL